MLKLKNAFSLIELSIVTLVIGVLISGFYKYDKIITKFRLISARTQTASSPVSSIKNLVAWYETTSEKSFINSESEDGLPVSIWYDINPQLALKKNATSSGSEKPFLKYQILACQCYISMDPTLLLCQMIQFRVAILLLLFLL